MNRFIQLHEELFVRDKQQPAAKGKGKSRREERPAKPMSRDFSVHGFDSPAWTFSAGNMNDVNERDEQVFSGAASVSVPAFCKLSPASDASTTNFTLGEFHCKDAARTPVPEPIRGNVQQLMEQLEVLRSELGKAILVTSGYRTVAHNKEVGGETNSMHLCGMAADIKVSGVTAAEVHATIERLIREGKMKQGGLGLYNSFVHYDIRGEKARWDNTKAGAQSWFGTAMQAGYTDWPVKFGTGDADYDKKAVAWIMENRKAVTAQPGLNKAKYHSSDYRGYMYAGNPKTDPVPNWGVTDPVHIKVYAELRKELFSEGGASSINTYDDQIVTVGWGFSMHAGSGIKVIKNNISTSSGFANELLKVGITVKDDRMLYMDTGASKVLSGTDALQKIRWDEKVLSKMIQAMEAYPDINTASQVKVFKEEKMSRVPAEVYQWPTDSIRLAVHLSHWLPVGIRWNDIKEAGGDVATIVKSFCKNLYAFQSDPAKNPKKKVYIKMSTLPNGALYANDSATRFDMGNRAFIKAGDAGTIQRIPVADFSDNYKTGEAYRNYVFVELNSSIYLLP